MTIRKEKIELLNKKLGEQLKKKKQTLVTAESCTGGLVAQTVTSIPGSSEWFDCGFVTYSNKSKYELLDVPWNLLNTFGAVSEQVAKEMAIGAIKKSGSSVSIAITGIAGPDGGDESKPVGTVYIAWGGVSQEVIVKKFFFTGDRSLIRNQAVYTALEYLVA